MQNQKTNNLALISLILGILGLLGMLPLVGSFGAVVLGHMARGQIAQDPSQTGDSLALGGLVTGYIGLFLACAGVAFVMLYFGGMMAFLAFFGLAAGSGAI